MNKQNVHWYPGHMKKAFMEIEPRLKIIDVVVEIVDARAPISSKNPFLEKLTASKQRILVFSKKDLCDEELLMPFIRHYEEKGYIVLPFDIAKKDSLNLLKKKIALAGSSKREKEKRRGMKPQPIRCMVLGIPNVGKSSLINRLAGRDSASKANKPGHTRAQQWIRVERDYELLDTPGILPPHYDDPTTALHLALIGSIPEDILPLSELCDKLLDFLLPRYEKEFYERFAISGSNLSHSEIIEAVASNRGLLLKEGTKDIDAAEKLILKEFKEGRIISTVIDTLC